MSKLFTKLFWLDATERIVATFCQVLASFVSVVVLAGGGVDKVNWALAFSVATLAAVYALLKAVGAAVKADTDTASFTVDTKPLEVK